MNHQVVCIGAMLVDELFYCKGPVIPATSNPATLKRSAGGVMRNIAQHLALLNIRVKLITVVGKDADGQWLKEDCSKAGIDMSHVITADCSTGKYAAILDPSGGLFVAAAVNPSESFLTIPVLQQMDDVLAKATIVVADTNLDPVVLEWLIGYCNNKNILLFIEPVSVAKAKKLSSITLNGLFMVTPNEDELASLDMNYSEHELVLRELIKRGVQYIWLRKGAKGSEIISEKSRYSLASPPVIVKDITGAGDAALAAWIAFYCMDHTEEECLFAAHAMAGAILQVEGAIDTAMNREKLSGAVKEYYPGG